MISRRIALGLGLTALTASLTGIHQLVSQAQSVPVVKIDGSSTVFPIMEAWAEEFQKLRKNQVQVTVGVSGTGGGFKKFCNGETDISNASRPILAKEIEACRAKGIRFMEIPVAFDALTVVINPRNTWVKSLTPDQLKKMWEPGSTVKTWNQVDPSWPNRPLRLFGPGTDSGTFDYFTEAINGKSKASRTDFTASEDDNVLVQGVATDVGGLGYFGLAYFEENAKRLKAVPIVNPKTKQPVLPSSQAVINNTYFPLSRPMFIYVNENAAKRREVRDFVNFGLSPNGAKLVKGVGYVALPADALVLARANFQKNRIGTVFGGVPEVGLTIKELLTREGKE
ncbi:MAG: PstS family phosphate ABC transporter substrate-binding protein [Gloeomargaritaceae cyanobacterium C42_A2020_066]|nr:PstS family phosphate ABC transporter substrate-binding protein [Gloeomargaritaceae cyanobacterium C42_A2020_066]